MHLVISAPHGNCMRSQMSAQFCTYYTIRMTACVYLIISLSDLIISGLKPSNRDTDSHLYTDLYYGLLSTMEEFFNNCINFRY